MLCRLLLLQIGLRESKAIALSSLEFTEVKPRLGHSRQEIVVGGCDMLAAALPEQVFWPNSSQYLTQTQSTYFLLRNVCIRHGLAEILM